MQTVAIADLKAHLSAHIGRVKRGEEIVVTHRNRPVARIVPIEEGESNEDPRRARLIALGRLRPAGGRAALPPPLRHGRKVAHAILGALSDEREGR